MEPNENFKPTVQWMAQKYDEMNSRLFRGQLGGCEFDIFTSGRGAEGRTLGYFSMQSRGLNFVRATRQMFIYKDAYRDERIEINRTNFADICRPIIKINGNYSGAEEAFLNTLVHEMCHYCTYMNGRIPRQSHGSEFKAIASHVAYMSNGEFTVTRLASAEDMSKLQLSDEMKAKAEKRMSSKKASITAIFRYKTNGEIQLTNSSSKPLIEKIINCHDNDDVIKVVTSNDQNLIDLLFSNGYKKNMRTWRYWTVTDKDWVKNLESYDIKVYDNPYLRNSEEVLNDPIFNESKMRNTRSIIREVIEEYIDNENGGVSSITPNMNLGIMSPFEGEDSY